MLLADRLIAISIMIMSVYFMWHATVLPIGWNGMTGGPGGGAFPFWLSVIMFCAAGGILVRSMRGESEQSGTFFDPETLASVVQVCISIIVTIALIPWLGAYVALPLFLYWYLKIFGKHSWTLTASITLITPVFLFFFFEVTLKILLPKGITEPLFIPLYARFF